MNPQSVLSRPRRRNLLLVFSLIFFCMCASGILPSAARQAEEREFKNTIPAHVPIKVKVKNEQSFKDIRNKNWARELEIEVKNTGSKPIYYMYMVIVMPEVLMQGSQLVFQVGYGRKELAFFDTPLEPEDVPIPPGESITLRISEGKVRAYEMLRGEQKIAEPKKIEFEMQRINYGDGTGYESPKGHSIHDSLKKRT